MSDETTQLEKVTDEELEQLREKRNTLFNTRDGVTDAYLTKQKCNRDLAYFESVYDQQVKEYNDVQKAITEKYGNVRVDLKTGILTYNGVD
jgi:regulator of PEP synthase PpsR (kinase-PPPase family)